MGSESSARVIGVSYGVTH